LPVAVALSPKFHEYVSVLGLVTVDDEASKVTPLATVGAAGE
jgi:hypothetical protein